jgi:hypothetical protein
MLIEEERNDELIDNLEGNAEVRSNEQAMLLENISRIAAEVKDSKRFNVYKQLQKREQVGSANSDFGENTDL